MPKTNNPATPTYDPTYDPRYDPNDAAYDPAYAKANPRVRGARSTDDPRDPNVLGDPAYDKAVDTGAYVPPGDPRYTDPNGSRRDPNNPSYGDPRVSGRYYEGNAPGAPDPRSDPRSPDYDPAYAKANPRLVGSPSSVTRAQLSALNSFKMDMEAGFKRLSTRIAHHRTNGAAVADYDDLQDLVTSLRTSVAGFMFAESPNVPEYGGYPGGPMASRVSFVDRDPNDLP